MVEVNLNCESDTRPEEYIIENILDGKCDIVLNENIEEPKKEVVDDNKDENIIKEEK